MPAKTQHTIYMTEEDRRKLETVAAYLDGQGEIKRYHANRPDMGAALVWLINRKYEQIEREKES